MSDIDRDIATGKARCSTCVLYAALDCMYGRCRRYAPVLVVNDPTGESWTESVQPHVRFDSVCGEWTPKSLQDERPWG